MDIVNLFKDHFDSFPQVTNDFLLVEYLPDIFVGIDKSTNVVVVVRSGNKGFPLIRKTQNMSIECNVDVTYLLNGKSEKGNVHILRCLSGNLKEKELFLELADVMLSEKTISESTIMETFSILRAFFNDKKEISDSELIGLYAELYTIFFFHNKINLEKYWQSRDKMKFDFSITEKFKLEVKATTKNSRIHHFRHEQLMTGTYDVYVASYMLRYDDEGLSLYDLMLKCKGWLSKDSRKLMKLELVFKNAGEERLKNLKFNQCYTDLNMHIYEAHGLPKFDGATPDGVSNAEYDCVLDNISYIELGDFVKLVEKAEAITEKEIEYV